MSIRLDKYLADMCVGTRSEVKSIISKGQVSVDNTIIKNSAYKINPHISKVLVNGSEVAYSQYEYIMLNKPAGVVSATTDNLHKTVLDIIYDKKRKDMFPVGRLDIDTEGLLIITNDGQLAHDLLSPRKHVPKTYFVRTDGILTEKMTESLKKGVEIADGNGDRFLAVADRIEELSEHKYNITIHEGKFHQVKRMFYAVGLNVLYLKRMSIGELTLDNTLDTGEYRQLSKQELEILWNATKQ